MNYFSHEKEITSTTRQQQHRRVKIIHPKFSRLVKECSELTGYELFRYCNAKGKTVPVDSADVNEYLQAITDNTFTSKDFRTWGASVLAVKKYFSAREKTLKNKRLKLKRAIVKDVASELQNTIAVCEKYYIHPKVLQQLVDNETGPELTGSEKLPESFDPEEKIVFRILSSQSN